MTIIFDYNKYLKEYQIYKNGLFELSSDGSKNSNLIEHLSDKTWVAKDITLLYDLAELTQKSFPLNRIDWENTFYDLAYDAYIKRLKTNDKKSLVDSMLEKMEMYSEEKSDVELMKSLKEGVREELKNRKII